ncbi:MAG: 7-cyano-7-deazaguanine synthase QueC [Firmicutes bacterium]|nr:7-cyano-7-deazaguanine synthase QueC [Bacillota bacterium]
MKVLVLSSGGVDSTTCLALAVEQFGAANVTALSMFYGQKHDKELAAARAVAAHYSVEHIELDLAPIFRYSNCSLLAHSDKQIPQESYADQLAESSGEPVSTYVPFRNGLFIAVAASVAESRGCERIFYGAHRDDAAGAAYPDCSEAFKQAMNLAVCEGTGGHLRLEAPFVEMNKAQVVAEGLRLNVPYHLTWSCYEGGGEACGVCGTCIDRIAAFAANGVADPIKYTDNAENTEEN